MTQPSATQLRGSPALDPHFLDVDWEAPAQAPPPPVPPAGPSGVASVWSGRARLAALVAGLAVLGFLLVGSDGPTGPARYGPIPATGEGPLGQILLAGPWQVATDPRAQGLARGWQDGRFGGPALSVPYVVNATQITGKAGSRSFAGSVAWYKTGLQLATGGTYAVRFQSVNHLATVWLDGREIAHHTGTYLPFDARFRAGPGPHVLVVRADWRDPGAMARAGFHRTWFNFGGINREVTIRPVGPSEVLTPLLRTQVGDSGADVTLRAVVHNYSDSRDLQVSGTLIHGSQRIALHFPSTTVAPGKSAAEIATAHIDSPALWQPGRPSLYDLDLEVGHESGYHASVGLRQLSWRGGRVLVNGHPVVLHGASIQEDVVGRGDGLTASDQDRIVSDLHSLGANATRAQHPLDIGLLQRLDAAGILVWEGVGPVDPAGGWSANTPSLRRAAAHRVRATVRQQQLHPAIVAWNLANEVAGNGHPGGQATYVQTMARELHRTDPGRMVALDVWGEHPPRHPGGMYAGVDAVGLTNYEGWYEDPLAPRAKVAARVRARVADALRTFRGKVVIVSEFGAEANGANPTSRPGGYRYQARLIGMHLAIYRRVPNLAGMLVWDLRDFAVAPSFAGGSISKQVPGIRLVKGLNQKGIFDYSGVPKPAVGVVRREFALLPLLG